MVRRIALPTMLLLLAAFPTTAGAASSYCSPTGDYCYGASQRSGRTILSIRLAARYFTSYRLCVTPPRGSSECRRFQIRRIGPVFGSTVRWSLHYRNRGRGTYRVSWRTASGRLGPGASFRR